VHPAQKERANFVQSDSLTNSRYCGIINTEREREENTMADRLLTKVIRKYGFEHPITIWVAKIIEKIF
jgi:hypothetical protein